MLPGPADIEVHGLTKRFRGVTAVDDLTFRALPGRVTGFLGPNGSGKTTTLRCILGLVRPTHGTATVAGRPITQLDSPGRVVGAALEASGFHPGRTAHDHLCSLAAASGLARHRALDVLDLVGLAPVANRRVGGFSLGMRQRLTLAGALLGEPQALILDEPANGLDPEGIAWLRGLLRTLAEQGCTVLVSSHALSEVQQSADDVVIISAGVLRYCGPLAGLAQGASPPIAGPRTQVRSPQRDELLAALAARHPQASLQSVGTDALIAELPPEVIGHVAFDLRLELHELSPMDKPTRVWGTADSEGHLEAAFLRMTSMPNAEQTP